jgi:hypothetical protein
MLYCSLVEAWGNEDKNEDNDDNENRFNYRKTISRKNDNRESFKNISKPINANRNKKKKNDYIKKFKINEKGEEYSEGGEEYSEGEEEYSEESDIEEASLTNNKFIIYIKKLKKENSTLKKRIKCLKQSKKGNSLLDDILSDKNREIVIVSLIGIMLVIIVHMTIKK